LSDDFFEILKNKLEDDDNKKRGRVKWFSEEKGYGFISPEDGGDDVFFHYSVIQLKGFKTLSEGQLVEFNDEKTNNGMKATCVKILFL